MRRYVTYSMLFHLGVVIFAYFGLPSFRETMDSVVPVSVEILTIADVTNVPTKVTQPPKPADKPVPPPLAPETASNTPPAPPTPEPEAPKPDEVALLPEAEPRPKPQVKQKPKSEDTPEKKTSSPQPKPKKKPAPPDPFASVLKTLEELKSAPPDEKPKEKVEEKPQPTFEEQMANALETKSVRQDLGQNLSISEIDLVRQQIARCWNLPAGAKDAHEMVVDISMLMNPDGTVSSAKIENQAQMAFDPFFRAMAESALTAVLRCSPLKLPPEKYENWKEMSLQFNPKEMFGL